MTVKVEFDKTGQPVGVDGAHAVTVNIDTGHEPGKLHVRFTAVPIGDDSLYAGSVEGHFTLTAPARFPSMDADEQAKVGAEYAAHMIAAMGKVVSADLAEAFKVAAQDAAKHGTHKMERGEKILGVIAQALVLLNHGDTAKAKADALRLAEGENVHGIDSPVALSPDDRAELVTALNAAIDAVN